MDEENIHYSEIIPTTEVLLHPNAGWTIVIQKITLAHQFKAAFPKH